MCGFMTRLIPTLVAIYCTIPSRGFGATETLNVCQHDIVTCNCTDYSVVRWTGTALINQCAQESIIYNIDNLTYQRTYNSGCGDLNVSTAKGMTTDKTTGENITIINSTLIFKAVDNLDGDTITGIVRDGIICVDIELSIISCNGTDGNQVSHTMSCRVTREEYTVTTRDEMVTCPTLPVTCPTLPVTYPTNNTANSMTTMTTMSLHMTLLLIFIGALL